MSDPSSALAQIPVPSGTKSLADLPYVLLLDHLLPLISLSGLLALSCTSKGFADICSDPILWQRKLETDFNFYPSSETARTSGFKLIYKGIHRPKIYVWGHLSHGRRGRGDSLPRGEAFPYPVEVKIRKRIVSMTSGGWSYHALDDTGTIHAWGALNGTTIFQSPPEDPSFSEPGSRTVMPIQLDLPTRFISTSCGRNHSAALDIKHRVWVFTRWGRPNLLTFTGTLDDPTQCHHSIAHTKVIQLDCGFDTSVTFLTGDGQVFIIWASSGPFFHQEAIANKALNQKDDGYPAKAVNGVVKCIPVSIKAEPLRLPGLPLNLPHLQCGVVTDERQKAPPKLIKIAAGNLFIVGLTDQGHVLYIDVRGGDSPHGLESLRAEFSSGERRWIYLPQFCEIDEIARDPVFAMGEDGTAQLQPPQSLNITHISSHWESFVIYSPGTSSVVLVANLTAWDAAVFQFERVIYPALQGRDIVSVAPSESHFAALDANGTLLTWGVDYRGSLGQGDLGRDMTTQWWRTATVNQPTQVRFDQHGGRMFCFSMTAGGWHTGALVFDLDDSRKSEDEDTSLVEEEETNEAGPSEAGPSQPLVKGKSKSVGLLDETQDASSSKNPTWKSWKNIFKRNTS